MLVTGELFNIVVNDFETKIFLVCNWIFLPTEPVERERLGVIVYWCILLTQDFICKIY